MATIYKVRTPHKHYLRLRMFPRFNAQVVGFIPNRTSLQIQHIKDGWGYTTYEGIVGWVYMRYLKKKFTWDTFLRKETDERHI